MKPKLPTIEERLLVAQGIEVRAATEDGSIPFKGYSTVWDRKANIYGMFTESFERGAFTKTLRESDVALLSNHNPAMVLARTSAETLRLKEDDRGLLNEAEMAPTSYANDLAISMKRGDVRHMSISFTAVREEWDESKKIPHRTVQEARLFETSIVTFAAYPQTSAALRSQQLDSFLRVFGFDELDDETRDKLLVEMHEGDVPPEHRDFLRAAQARIASLVDGSAGDPPSDPPDPDAPAVDHATGSRSLYQRRLSAIGLMYGLS